MERTCSKCIPEYKCSCTNLCFCKHSKADHQTSACSLQHAFDCAGIQDYHIEKSNFKVKYLLDLIEILKNKLKESEDLSEATLADILKLCILKIRVKEKPITGQLNLYFFKNLELHSFDPVTSEQSNLGLKLGCTSYVSICIYFNKVYFAGGANISGFIPTREVQVLNTQTGVVKLLCLLGVECYMTASAVLDEKLFVIGGKLNPDRWVNLVQVVNLLSKTVSSHEFECRTTSVCCTAFKQKIYFSKDDSTINVINSSCKLLDTIQTPKEYGQIIGLSSSELYLFICHRPGILIIQEDLKPVCLVSADVDLEWLPQSPAFYQNSLFFFDQTKKEFFSVPIPNNPKSSSLDPCPSDPIQQDSPETSHRASHQSSIPSSGQVSISYADSDSLNLSSAHYS